MRASGTHANMSGAGDYYVHSPIEEHIKTNRTLNSRRVDSLSTSLMDFKSAEKCLHKPRSKRSSNDKFVRLSSHEIKKLQKLFGRSNQIILIEVDSQISAPKVSVSDNLKRFPLRLKIPKATKNERLKTLTTKSCDLHHIKSSLKRSFSTGFKYLTNISNSRKGTSISYETMQNSSDTSQSFNKQSYSYSQEHLVKNPSPFRIKTPYSDQYRNQLSPLIYVNADIVSCSSSEVNKEISDTTTVPGIQTNQGKTKPSKIPCKKEVKTRKLKLFKRFQDFWAKKSKKKQPLKYLNTSIFPYIEYIWVTFEKYEGYYTGSERGFRIHCQHILHQVSIEIVPQLHFRAVTTSNFKQWNENYFPSYCTLNLETRPERLRSRSTYRKVDEGYSSAETTSASFILNRKQTRCTKKIRRQRKLSPALVHMPANLVHSNTSQGVSQTSSSTKYSSAPKHIIGSDYCQKLSKIIVLVINKMSPCTEYYGESSLADELKHSKSRSKSSKTSTAYEDVSIRC